MSPHPIQNNQALPSGRKSGHDPSMGFRSKHLRMLGGVGVAAALLPVVGQWFVSLADELGLYRQPVEHARMIFAAITGSLWFHWIGGAALGFAAGVWLDGAVRRMERKAVPPLEMIFDPKNPNGRFWSTQTWTAKDGSHRVSGTEYRVELRNNTQSTIEGVILTGEIMSETDINPGNSVFVRNRETSIDIHPMSSESAIICLVDDSEPEQVSVVVRARAKNTPEVTLRFVMNEQGGLSLAGAP